METLASKDKEMILVNMLLDGSHCVCKSMQHVCVGVCERLRAADGCSFGAWEESRLYTHVHPALKVHDGR